MNSLTEAPLNGLTTEQLFSRTNMSLLWTNKGNVIDKSQKALLKVLYDNKARGTLEGKINITYRLSSHKAGEMGYGRYYGQKGSLEAIDKDIRGTLCSEYYTDIDIVNCHPVLMVQLSKRFGIDMPGYSYYNEHRDELIDTLSKQHNCFPSSIKDVPIRIAYGGAIKYENENEISSIQNKPVIVNYKNVKIDLWTTMQNDIKRLVEKLINSNEYTALYAFCTKQKSSNIKGTFLSYILQTYERKCLEAMVTYFNNEKLSVDVLCYDGCMVRSKTISDDILVGAENAVKEATDFDIKLKTKELIGIDEKELNECDEDGILAENIIIDDKYASEALIKMLDGNIVKEDGIVYVYNEDIGMWENHEDVLHATIAKYADKLIFKQKKADAIKTNSFGGSWKSVTAIANYIKTILPESKYISENSSKSLKYILFADGIYDIANRTFSHDFDREKVFTSRICDSFYADRNSTIETELNKSLFVNPFTNADVGEYIKFIIARAIAGHIEDKKFYAVLGLPNCGKGTITIGLNHAFGAYVGEWNIDNVKYNPKSGTDEAKKLSWLVPMRKVRCAFSNESRMDRFNLDGNLIKKLASGGDGICMRQNFKDESIHVLPTTFFYFGNDIATISPMDKAIETRMRFIRFVKTFVDKPFEECGPLEMPADATIKEKLKTREYRNALFWLIMEAYRANYKDMAEPIDVIEETAENVIVEEKEMKKILEEEYEFTANEDDCVPSRELINYLKRNGVNMSDTKIGRELRNLGLKNKDKKVEGKTMVVYVGIKH